MDLKIDLSDTYIETDRLLLRLWRPSDLEDFFEYASEEGVGEMAGWRRHYTIRDTEKVLNMFMRHKSDLAICHKSSMKTIGSIGLNSSWANVDEVLKSLKIKDLGFVLSKEYWNMGLMTEALSDLIPYCFENLNMDAITCGHFSDNLKSQRVIEKLDFTFIGEREFNSFPLKRIFSHLKYIKFKKVPIHVGEALGLFEYC